MPGRRNFGMIGAMAALACLVAGCDESFTDAYTAAALAPHGSAPSQQMDRELQQTGQQTLKGVDTSNFDKL